IEHSDQLLDSGAAHLVCTRSSQGSIICRCTWKSVTDVWRLLSGQEPEQECILVKRVRCSGAEHLLEDCQDCIPSGLFDTAKAPHQPLLFHPADLVQHDLAGLPVEQAVDAAR